MYINLEKNLFEMIFIKIYLKLENAFVNKI